MPVLSPGYLFRWVGRAGQAGLLAPPLLLQYVFLLPSADREFHLLHCWHCGPGNLSYGGLSCVLQVFSGIPGLCLLDVSAHPTPRLIVVTRMSADIVRCALGVESFWAFPLPLVALPGKGSSFGLFALCCITSPWKRDAFNCQSSGVSVTPLPLAFACALQLVRLLPVLSVILHR